MFKNFYKNIVPTNLSYNYSILIKNINDLKSMYSFLELGIIGESVLLKKIPYIKIGVGKREVLYHGGIHAKA